MTKTARTFRHGCIFMMLAALFLSASCGPAHFRIPATMVSADRPGALSEVEAQETVRLLRMELEGRGAKVEQDDPDKRLSLSAASLLGGRIFTAEVVDLRRGEVEAVERVVAGRGPGATKGAVAALAARVAEHLRGYSRIDEGDGRLRMRTGQVKPGPAPGDILLVLRDRDGGKGTGGVGNEKTWVVGKVAVGEREGDRVGLRVIEGDPRPGDWVRLLPLSGGPSPPDSAAAESDENPDIFVDPSTGMEFILVRGGTFSMGDTFGKGWLGVEFPDRRSTLISRVLPGGPADRAGIREGAHLLAVDGATSDRPAVLTGWIQEKLPGETAEIRVIQDGTRREFTVTLDSTRNDSGVQSRAVTTNYAEGTRPERDDELPVHEVALGDFYLGRTEVTWAQWEKIMGPSRRRCKGCGPDTPARNVSFEIDSFIMKLRKESGEDYRLPTEAEWEFAARSGGEDERWAGTSDPSVLGQYAWFAENAQGKAHPVGRKKPNGLGLYDMTGNVSERCSDWYDRHYYDRSPRLSPGGPPTGDGAALGERGHVHRGGDAGKKAWLCRNAGRRTDWGSKDFIGLRLVREAPRRR